jgi:tRNA-2-methylthio-N6-dimethylallyladenosine synthase
MFKYSERKNTIASKKYPDDVPEDEKTSRITRLVDLQQSIAFERNQVHLGQEHLVLVEGKGKKPNQLLGRNDGNKSVAFTDNGASVGELVKVKINEATSNTLIGTAV